MTLQMQQGCTTARSVEDETRNAEINGNRNPEWWGDFSQLQIQITPKSQLMFQFPRSLLPRSVEKRPRRLKLEIEIQ